MSHICSCGSKCDCNCGCNPISSCQCGSECKCSCACTNTITLSSIASRVALGCDYKLFVASPDSISESLERIASYIDASDRVSLSRVKSAILRILIATDRSLALTVRNLLVENIQRLVPGEFEEQLYDTNPEGKGFRPGYVSFAFKPVTWDNADIIGGMLFRCTYDSDLFRSESPEKPDTNWKGHSKGGAILDMNLEVGYYNKTSEGSYSDAHQLGAVTVIFDANENVTDFEFTDSAAIVSGIKGLIQDIEQDPPAVAQSVAFKKRSRPPTTSPAALLKFLNKTNRQEVGQSEIEALARAMADRSGAAYQMVFQQVKEFFTKRHIGIDPHG